jgi:HlyD family secretion protein
MALRDWPFLQREPSAHATRHLMLKVLLVFCAGLLLWISLARLDIVAVAPGKLVPQTYLRIVQPLEHGIVREILVREGEHVAEGQVLMRMDPRPTETDLKVVENDLRRKELQLRGIEAEIEGRPMGRRAGDDPVWLAQIEAQQSARRRAHQDALEVERAALNKATADLQAAQVVEARLQRTVPMYKATADGWAELAAQGFAGKLLAQERMRLYVESEHELKAQIQAVASLRSAAEQAGRRLAQVDSNYRQQLQNQRVEILADIERLREERERHAHRHRLTELRAPQAGIVKDLATHTAGTVAAPGTILLTLVPATEPLLAEVWINNEDIGFVRKDQPVRLKLSAFQFQKYGMVEGKVRHVSADASDTGGAASAAVEITRARGSAPLAYKALIELTSQELVAQGRRYPLSPGMQVAAEIHLGTRSLLSYLLSPITGVVHEAGRER